MILSTVLSFLFITSTLASPTIKAVDKSDALQSLHTPTKSTRLTGAQPATAGQFPWQAAINVNQETAQYFCGGAIIGDMYILTAAHCTADVEIFVIYLGTHRIQPADATTSIVATTTAYQHDEYNPWTIENDIALIKVHMTIRFTDYILPIVLNRTVIPEGGLVTVAGWGETDPAVGGYSNELNYVELVTISTEECQRYFTTDIYETQICAQANFAEGICIGDTGGPLVIYQEFARSSVIGIASFFATSCQSGYPSGFTRVEPYLDWIDTTTAT